MPDYAWPDAEHRTLIGKRISRVDSPAKVSGQAKYTYDVHRPGMLYGKVLRSPYAHAKLAQRRYQCRGEDARREGRPRHPGTRFNDSLGG